MSTSPSSIVQQKPREKRAVSASGDGEGETRGNKDKTSKDESKNTPPFLLCLIVK